MTKSYDTVIANPRKVAQTTSEKPEKKAIREYKYITLNEASENYKAQLSDPKLKNKNTGYFLDVNDEDTKKFIEEAQKEIEQCIKDGEINGSIELRGRRANAFALRVPLKDDKGSFSAEKFFDSEFCKNSEPKITAVTLYVTQEQIRGLRVSQNDKEVRLYEIINGSYTITFNWKVDDRDCSIAVSVGDDGNVTYSNPSKGLTTDDLEKNTDVNITIGEDLPKKLTLAELVAKDPREQAKLVAKDPQLEQKSSEEVKASQQPLSQMASVKEPAQAELVAKDPQLEQKSSEEVKASQQPLSQMASVKEPAQLQASAAQGK